ncbi:MAG: helix-turn-helix domain-containing protein [Phycisphaerales bacterium]
MQYSEHRPIRGPLSGVVEVIFCIEQYAPAHQRERLVPSGRSHLVIELDGADRLVYDSESGEPIFSCRGAWFAGVHTRHLTITAAVPKSRLAVVQFMPGMSWPILNLDPEHCADRIVLAADNVGDDLNALRDTLLDLSTCGSVVERLEKWVASRFDKERMPHPYISAVLSRILSAPQDISFADMVNRDGEMSYKHFVDLFKKHVGISPKKLQRIARFGQVLEQAGASVKPDWAFISARLGYADQSHCIRDFRAFSGLSPTEFARLSDGRTNFFPEQG